MKALVYTEPNVLLCREEPEPTPGNDEVLVRVEAVGICGSDMHAYHGHDSRRPPPFVLGHEAAGLVVSGPGRGARVAVNPLVPCGVCDWCLQGRPHLCPSRQLLSVPPRTGAFAELVRVPEANVLGEVGKGFAIANDRLSRQRVNIACGQQLAADPPVTLFDLHDPDPGDRAHRLAFHGDHRLRDIADKFLLLGRRENVLDDVDRD